MGRRTAPSPSRASSERDAETPAYDEEQLRDEAGLPGGCQPDRARHDPQPHLEQAVDHRHRHRRTQRRERVEHAEPRGRACVISARIAPGQPAREAYRRDRGAPARARAVRGAARPSATVDSATPSWSTRAAGRSTTALRRDARGLRRRTGRDRRRRVDPVHRRSRRASSPRRRSSSPASRTRTPERTARTSRCTSRRSATRCSPRRFCSRSSTRGPPTDGHAAAGAASGSSGVESKHPAAQAAHQEECHDRHALSTDRSPRARRRPDRRRRREGEEPARAGGSRRPAPARGRAARRLLRPDLPALLRRALPRRRRRPSTSTASRSSSTR